MVVGRCPLDCLTFVSGTQPGKEHITIPIYGFFTPGKYEKNISKNDVRDDQVQRDHCRTEKRDRNTKTEL